MVKVKCIDASNQWELKAGEEYELLPSFYSDRYRLRVGNDDNSLFYKWRFGLPDVYAVRLENSSEFNTIADLLKTTGTTCNWRYFIKSKEGFMRSDNVDPSISILTPSLWKELYFSEQQKLNQVDKKIIGYKAPTALYDGFIPMGTVYMALSSVNTSMYAAVKDGRCMDSGRTNLPKEVVEAWEPVYEENKVYPAKSWVKIKDMAISSGRYHIGGVYQLEKDFIQGKTGFCTLFDDKINRSNGWEDNSVVKVVVEEASDEEIKKAQTISRADIMIGGYVPVKTTDDVKGDVIAFGCVHLSMSDLQGYLYLMDSDAEASIEVRGEKISAVMIKKLIQQLQNGEYD